MNLGDLIRNRKEALGFTYKALGEAAEQSGYPVSRTMFHQYETQPLDNIPPTNTIRGLAAALQLTPDDVLSAAAESIGLGREDHQKGASTAAMIALLANRTPEELAELESVVRSAIRLLDTRPLRLIQDDG